MKQKKQVPDTDSLEQYRMLINLAPDVIYAVDRQGVIVLLSPAFEKITGWKISDWIGKPFKELIHPDDLPLALEKFAEGMQNKQHPYELRIKANNGNYITGEFRNQPYLQQGKILGKIGIARDITERKVAEQKLKEREDYARALIANSTEAVRLMDAEGKVKYISPSIKKLLGYPYEEYLKHNIFSLIHPDDKKAFLATHKKIIQHPGKPFTVTYRARHKNGSWRWFEGTGTNLLHIPSVAGIVSNFRDITERKTFEDKLWQANHTLETIITASPLAVYVVDTAGNVRIWNKVAEQLFGWKAAEVKGKPLPLPPKEKQSEFAELMQLLLSGQSFTKDLIRQRKDGSLIDVSISAAPLKDETGKITGIVAITADISERVAAQRKKDEFISLAAHELRTPVTSIKLFLDVLQGYVRSGKIDRLEHFITQISEQTNRLTDLVNDLLDVSRIETGKLTFQMETFCLSTLIDETVATVAQMAPDHIFKKYAPRNVEIRGDKYRIYQVISNLLTNASKYSPQNRQISITLNIKNDQAIVSVTDQGIGIPKLEQQKIFDKLYQVTNKDIKLSAGLGMGLYIAREIITGHQGKIWVKSTPGKGSTFSFSLPYERK